MTTSTSQCWSSLAQAKVAVLGAAGGIGQPLSLLMKTSPYVSELSLYDVANTPGVAADLSHMSTASVVKGYLGPDQLGAALQGCQLVIIPAGMLLAKLLCIMHRFPTELLAHVTPCNHSNHF